jgi:hypothetical protein
MSQKEPKKTPASAPTPPPDPDQLPPWLPTGNRWNDLPEALRQAVPRVLIPAYRQFVLDAADQLQRSAGMTLVHLLWLELCNQMHMVDAVADPMSLAATVNDPERMIDRHLTLVAAKSQTTELLAKLRLIGETLAAVPRPGVPSLGTDRRPPARDPAPAPSVNYTDAQLAALFPLPKDEPDV